MPRLILKEGSVFKGTLIGYSSSSAGEVVFNTGMVGYPESMTDPSYYGQILVLTFPLIGNYGIDPMVMESDKIQIKGLIVSEYSEKYSHWSAKQSLNRWLIEHKVPGLSGVDTRRLTKTLREHGTMLGKILIEKDIAYYDPDKENLVTMVSLKEKKIHKAGKKKIFLVDCGVKNNIIKTFLKRNITVVQVPWDYDFTKEEYDGLFISNGPGDPKMCKETISNLKKAMKLNKPIFGICLGNQLLGLAAGANTYKLKYGHRSQNQPCIHPESKRCYITSQNHGFAIDDKTLPKDWEPWFTNINDGTNEGIRHKSKPFFSVQFHPEAAPGPTDTDWLFDEFVSRL